MDPIKIYDYLTKSRQRIFDAVRLLAPQQYQHEFPFGLKTIGSTITHIMISEWYYIERLEGRDVRPYNEWQIKYEDPPPFEVVESTWRKQADDVRGAIKAQETEVGPDGTKGWNRRISYLSFPDDTRDNRRFHITATAGDVITQLALHEVHHRAQIMTMLRTFGHAVQDLDYNELMYERTVAS